MKEKSPRVPQVCEKNVDETIRRTSTRRLDGYRLYTATRVQVRQACRGELPKIRRRARRYVTDAEGDRSAGDRQENPEAIGEPTHQDPAHADADHRHRVGQRRI